MQDSTVTAIVIGGGIAGCSTAYALAKRGITVTLIERHDAVAQEASGNPVGMLYPKFNTGVSLLSSVASHGFNFTLSLLKQLPNKEVLYHLCGQIQLAFNLREQEKQLKLLETTKSDLALQWLSASEASAKANIDLSVGGLYLPESGWVKPQLFCQTLIKSDLITKHVSTAAIQIAYDTNWTVSLSNEQKLSADIIVLCNANELHQFDYCKHLPITPVRGQVNFFEATAMSQHMQPVICSDHYLSPAVDGRHSIGTSYAPNEMNPNLSIEDTQANLLALKKISPALFHHIQLENLTGRVAWRSATRDYLPLAGPLIDEVALRKTPPRYNDNPRNLPWLHGLYINAGHGSKGMITAPLCGELIASLITNNASPLIPSIAAKLNPSRFLLRDLGLKQMAQNLYDF